MTPTHAWARRGERAKGSVPSSWGSTTVIAALGLDRGTGLPLVFPGATDAQAFQTYVDQVLVPELRPGGRGGLRQPQAPPLSARGGVDRAGAGATVLPLPPYSWDYDPIEELWSKFKGQLRRIARRGRRTACTRRSVRPWEQCDDSGYSRLVNQPQWTVRNSWVNRTEEKGKGIVAPPQPPPVSNPQSETQQPATGNGLK